MTMIRCPNCDAAESYIFHRVPNVPVNSCLLFADRGRAEGLARGDIDLAFCRNCAFVFNAAWQSGATVYTDLYEETQVFSPTFSAYQQKLAEDLIDRYDVFGKEIVEIGCGKGAFLTLLCELGGNSGVGYDPSFVPERSTAGKSNIVFKREYFSETTDQRAPDLVCCRMTLEHISETRRFIQSVRRITSPERGTIVFFQIPDVRRILAEGAFWDIYYEHCSYFCPASLERLFRSCSFDVLRMTGGFGDQYLAIEARAVEDAKVADVFTRHEDVEHLAADAEVYTDVAARSAADWEARISAVTRAGGRVVLWGSGSKAVAFLSAVDAGQEIEYLVDVNPHRWGKYVPGTGKQIVSPEYLSSYSPDLVIAMNPVYREEIAADLNRFGCKDALLCALGDVQVEPIAASTLVANAAGA